MRNFTIEDFSGAGQYLVRMCPSEIYQRDNNLPITIYNTSFLSTVMKKVGWIVNNHGIGNGEQIYTLTDMSDGLTRVGNYTNPNPSENNDWSFSYWQREDENDKDGGKRKLVEYLNNPELSQEHRFATQEEVVRVVLYQKSRWK